MIAKTAETAKPSPDVAGVFESFPPDIRAKLLALRHLIFETAATTEGVGELTETLKWGEPAYLTSASKSGSTIRLGWNKARPEHYAMYFNCQTNLVETFRTLFPDDFDFEGNRAVVLEKSAALPTDAVVTCIATALTYHRSKKSAAKSQVSTRRG